MLPAKNFSQNVYDVPLCQKYNEKPRKQVKQNSQHSVNGMDDL